MNFQPPVVKVSHLFYLYIDNNSIVICSHVAATSCSSQTHSVT